MLATVMNCIYVHLIFSVLQEWRQKYLPCLYAVHLPHYFKHESCGSIESGKGCFLCRRTGHPYFLTDTGAVLRAIEIEADVQMAKAP